MTGVAVYDSLAELHLRPDIKWVNDVLVGDRKICGILAETTETSKGLAVVVGIGINLTSANFLMNSPKQQHRSSRKRAAWLRPRN
jgi:biotin-(acetyl-CoA carboxylase) ligase